ncbi:hypothetical protein B0H11DRAFT_1931769 [Mycena galericulata]|nr:hypothetical protein B0H11DRAFT_1931769 [Mycena galericulata]
MELKSHYLFGDLLADKLVDSADAIRSLSKWSAGVAVDSEKGKKGEKLQARWLGTGKPINSNFRHSVYKPVYKHPVYKPNYSKKASEDGHYARYIPPHQITDSEHCPRLLPSFVRRSVEPIQGVDDCSIHLEALLYGSGATSVVHDGLQVVWIYLE